VEHNIISFFKYQKTESKTFYRSRKKRIRVAAII